MGQNALVTIMCCPVQWSLPLSYIGGSRYMNQCFQDAIALAQYYYGFNLFITFTTNTSWPEITNTLLSSQMAADCPDLTVRVFNIYKKLLINDLIKDSIFSDALGYVYTIEFQKCGLPHMHLLLSLTPCFRSTTAEEVDTIVRATWPNPKNKPHLFNIVKCCMVHGPCGQWKCDAPCIKDEKCSKGFPKPFQAETVITCNGYPIYAQPNNSRGYKVCNFTADNQWIVPYNPYLLSWYIAFFNLTSIRKLTML